MKVIELKRMIREIIKEENESAVNEANLDNTALDGVSSFTLTGLKDAYYGAGDHIYDLEEHLRNALKRNPKWKGEYKLAQQLSKVFRKLETGKIL